MDHPGRGSGLGLLHGVRRDAAFQGPGVLRAYRPEAEDATWAAGHKQGRDDVVTTLPLIMAYITAQEGSTCRQHGPHEVIEHA